MSGPISRETKTLLLTDIEGSTSHWERDPGVMGEALARHDAIVRQAVEAAGGRLIKQKGEGDSTFSVFDSPHAAVAAAISLQQAIQAERWTTAEPLRVRAGIHTGEVEARDGDYYGRTVNRAARVRGLAVATTILTTAVTVALIGSPGPDGVAFIDVGEHQLRGVREAEHLFAVSHTSLPDPEEALSYLRRREGPSVPAALRLHGDAALIGRERELAALHTAWSAAAAGRASLALVGGEPGVGKTRLAAALAERVTAEGALALFGRCEEDPQRSYQPLAEALAGEIERLSPSEADALAGDVAGELSLIIPELEIRLGPRDRTAGERSVLFRAVAGTFARLAADRPVLLVVDDLQWADEPSLALLHHLLSHHPDSPMLIVATHRDADVTANPTLMRSLVDLRRCAPTVDIGLEGLERASVSTLLGEAHAQHLEAIWSASDGNPFFVLELRRGLEDGRGGVPPSVRQSVADRVSRLPAATQHFVHAAAIAGLEVEVDLTADAAGVDEQDADSAVAHGVLVEVPDDLGRLRFGHALVRTAILDGMTAVQRARLHRRVAAAIEAHHADRLDDLAARLAHHYRDAGSVRADGPAYLWSMRAGQRAGQLLAYEDAENHYRAASRIARADGDDARRIAADLELAEVLARSGHPATGHAMAEAAAAEATAIGATELAGWAVFAARFGQALGLEGSLTAIRAARAALSPDSPWSGPLDVVLAAELMQSGAVADGMTLLRATEARARAAGDATLVALALTGSHMFIDRLATPVDAILASLPRGTGTTARSLRLSAPVLRVQAESLRVGQLVAAGDVVGARAAAAAFTEQFGDETGIAEANIPLFAMTDALLSGAWDEWRRQRARFQADPELAAGYASHLLGSEMMAAWVKGSLSEGLALIEMMPPSMMLARPVLALALAEAGRRDEAQAVVAACAADGGLAARARSVPGRAELAILAYAVSATADAPVASELFELFAPRRGQVATWAGWAFWGAVDGILGMLAATCGRWDAAVEHLDAALRLHDRSGWHVLSVMSAAELSAALIARDREGDRSTAARIAAEASSRARSLGLLHIERRLASL